MADAFECCPQPFAVFGGGVVQPHLFGLHRHHVQGRERARVGGDVRKVQRAQIVTELFVAADALVVVDGIAAAIQDQPLPVDLDRAGMVGGMAAIILGI